MWLIDIYFTLSLFYNTEKYNRVDHNTCEFSVRSMELAMIPSSTGIL